MTKWDPFEEVGSLRRAMDRLFDDFFTTRRTPGVDVRDLAGHTPMAWEPAIEMYETDSEVVLKAEMPNIDPQNVDITVNNDSITLKGQTRVEEERKDRNYFRRELRYGWFARTLPLPVEVKSGEAKATYRDGVLEVKMPKSNRARPTAVKVQIG